MNAVSWTPSEFMPVRSEVYSDIQQFLIYEALLLDHGCTDKWLTLFSDSIKYMLLDCTIAGSPRTQQVAGGRNALRDHMKSLRTGGLDGSGAERRTACRCVMNVSISFANSRREYAVHSYLRVTPLIDTRAPAWNAERRDLLLSLGRTYRICSRILIVDGIDTGHSLPAATV
jgi:3-phenylpropionate/cinnamic acid dioxygenase small subunit